jgi:hypothetical protein
VWKPENSSLKMYAFPVHALKVRILSRSLLRYCVSVSFGTCILVCAALCIRMRGGFLKLIKMKIFLSLLAMCAIFITVGAYLSKHKSVNAAKKKITDQIFLYKDSINNSRAKLALIGAKASLDYRDGCDPTPEQRAKILAERLVIRAKMYGYQWKIDSLNIRLKEY